MARQKKIEKSIDVKDVEEIVEQTEEVKDVEEIVEQTEDVKDEEEDEVMTERQILCKWELNRLITIYGLKDFEKVVKMMLK